MRCKIGKIAVYLILVIGAFISLLPFLWMFLTSFKTPYEAVLIPPTWIPKNFVLYGYKRVLSQLNFLQYFKVSFTVVVLNIIGVLFTSILAAYAFSWLRFRGRETIFVSFLALMMIPIPVYVLPLFILVQKFGWVDTYMGLVVPWCVNVFSIFLLRQQFRSIPKDLYESAIMDGCSRLKFIWKILLPLSKPTLITIIIFNTIGAWNAFMWPLMVTISDKMRPIQVGLAYFAQGESTDYPALMAASSLAILPLILLFFIFQRYIIASYMRSGLKE